VYVKVLLVVVVVMHGLVWRVSGALGAGCKGSEQSGISGVSAVEGFQQLWMLLGSVGISLLSLVCAVQ